MQKVDFLRNSINMNKVTFVQGLVYKALQMEFRSVRSSFYTFKRREKPEAHLMIGLPIATPTVGKLSTFTKRVNSAICERGYDAPPPVILRHELYVHNPTACYMSTKVESQFSKEKEIFEEVLPSVIDPLVKNSLFSQSPEVRNWVQKLMDYTLAGGNKTLRLTTVFAYEAVEKPENITPESLRKARVLGWCVEILKSNLMLTEDLMNRSKIRMGKPCWYTLPNVGMGVVNDTLIIQCSIFETLKANFREMPLYSNMVELFNETIIYSSMGLHLDYTMAWNKAKTDYSLFTIDKYNTIVKYKSAYCAFRLPILLGYLLANNSDRDLHRKVEVVCFDLAMLDQIQDDILDCVNDKKATCKGINIQEGKCSWLAVHALNLCNDAQRASFKENYADKDPAKVKAIKNLFQELNLLELYTEVEKGLYKGILEKTKAFPVNDRKVFYKLLDITYKRKK